MEKDLAMAMAALTNGIYVLTVSDGNVHHGMSSSWVTQVSGDPVLFSAAVDNDHFSCGLIQRTRTLALNVVGSRGKSLEDYFYSAEAKRPDNLAGLDVIFSPILRLPWLGRAAVSLEARVRDAVVAGDHTIFIAEPVGVAINQNDRPLTSLDLDYVYLGGRQVLVRDKSGW
jgi:flavin reductase (DIM6/NTAB) family NADH-FMN oxidoreductase RutF